MRLLIITIFISSFMSSFSQKNIEIIDSKEILNEALDFYGNEEYEKAIKIYDKVERNDTNYLLAQFQSISAYYYAEDYKGGISVCKKFLNNRAAVGNEYEYLVYNYLGLCYDHSGDLKMAIETYDNALEKYPHYNHYSLNKAVAYKRKEQFEKALDVYKEQLNNNAFYSNTHSHIGLMAANEDKFTQAMLSLTMAAITSMESDNLTYLDSYANGDVETESIGLQLNKEKNSDDFDEIDLIVKNKVALNRKYKTPSKFEYPFIKQLHVILENLEYDKKDEGFWMQYYVPYFKAVLDEGQFANMTYLLMGISNNEDVQKNVKSKLNEMKEFYAWHNKNWREIHGHINKSINGENKKYHLWYKDENLKAIGNKNAQNEVIGQWEYYYENGKMLSYGGYSDSHKRHGKWVFYQENGNKDVEYTYDNDEYDGEYVKYDFKGNKRQSGQYSKGKRNGTVQNFYKDGTLRGEWVYKDDVIIERSKEYYTNGKLQYEIPYNEKNEIDGKVLTHYPTGQLKSNMNWKEGERHGKVENFYVNDQLSSSYNYDNGLYDGVYEEFFMNGTLKEKGSYSKGKTIGKTESYYRNGNIEEIYYFDENGKRNGKIEGFSKEGFKYYELEYSKGELIGYIYFNEAGEVTKEAMRKRNKLSYVFPYDNGQTSSEGLYLNDEKDGEWKNYAKNGRLTNTKNYVKGDLNGDVVYYHRNGKKSSTYGYKDGLLHGPYKSFYIDGTLKSEGNYLDDNVQGIWRNYFSNGLLENEKYFLNDELHGFQDYYNELGKLKDTYLYKEGIIQEVTTYDTTGNIIHTVSYKNGTADIEYRSSFGEIIRTGFYKNNFAYGYHKYYEGKNSLIAEGEYLNDEKNGVWKWFKFGKLVSEANYVNGDLHGEYRKYHPNGQVKVLEPYEYGLNNGTVNYYYDDGSLNRDSPYQDDDRNGISHYFSRDGELQYVKYHKNGFLIGYSYNDADGNLKEMIPLDNESGQIKALFKNGKTSAEIAILYGSHNNNEKRYYANGQVESEFINIDGELNGSYAYYFSDGKVKEEGNYLDDEFNGKRSLYYENGKLKQEINYIIGQLYGEVNFYNEQGKKTRVLNYYNNNIVDEKTF